MKTLILSCNTGQGHNSCARAIKEYYDRAGESCAVEDALSFVSGSFSSFISWGHSTVYRYLPWLFRFGYRCTERHPAVFRERSGIYKLLTSGCKGLYAYIISHDIDAVICAHPFAAIMMTELLKSRPGCVVSANLATDYVCHPGVKDTALDMYFIPDKSLAGEFVSSCTGPEKIISSGLPVRQMFYSSMAKAEAKKLLGIEAGQKHLVMMCGSMGCGPMEELAKSLTRQLESDVALTIVCGTNHHLQERLNREYCYNSQVKVLGYVKNMSALMDSADLCLTKPGGISTTEAAVKGLPMVLIDAVSGCEKYNLEYFSGLGGARSGKGISQLTDISLGLLKDGGKLQAMRESLETMSRQNGPQIIYEHMKKLTDEKYNEKKLSCC